jgi:hypothetical protein
MKSRGEAPGDVPMEDASSNEPDEAVERLRRAISAASTSGSSAELEAAAIQLVEALKATNHPPEQMLLRIKQLLGDAGVRPNYSSNDSSSGAGHATLYRDVIAWSIRHYYGGTGPKAD